MLALKRVLGRAWHVVPRNSRRRVILLYHAVGSGEWATPRDDFARQMEWIASVARPLSLVQALGTEVEQSLEFAITFDDAYASVFEEALPVLKSLGLTAAVFANTALVGENDRVPADPSIGHYPGEAFMLWRELDRLLDCGWVLGSHGANHLRHWLEPEAVVREELLQSKKNLERLTPGPCNYFAYTWGRSTPRLKALVNEAGYPWALGVRHGPVRRVSDPLDMPRINIDRSCSLDDFKAIVSGDWDYLRGVQALRSGAA